MEIHQGIEEVPPRPLANRLLGEAGTLVVAEPIQCDKTQNKISNIKIIYDVI